MHCRCPHCSHRVKQLRNTEGPQFCRNCHELFIAPVEKKLPPWILGVLVVLTANWQIILTQS